MQGISKRKHEHFISALQRLEYMLQEEPASDNCKHLATQINELSNVFEEYLFKLDELSEHIGKYDALYTEIRNEHLRRTLRGLKKRSAYHYEEMRKSLILAFDC